MAQVQKALVKVIPGTSTIGRIVKARLVESDGDREPALKLLVECKNGETIVIYDSFRKDRTIGGIPYSKALCREFEVKSVEDLPEALKEKGEEYLVKQVLIQQKNDKGVLQVTDDDEPVFGNPQGRIELLF